MDGESPVDSVDSTDSKYADLIDQYMRIQRGYHALADECIETEEMFLQFVNHQEDHVRRHWYIADTEARRHQRTAETAEGEGGKAQGIIKNIRIQLQNEMDRRLETEDRMRLLERLLDKFKGILESGMVTDEQRQRLFRSADELARGPQGQSRVWTGIRKSEDIDMGRISFDRSDDEMLDEDDAMEMENDVQTTTRRISLKNEAGEMTKFAKLVERGDGDVEIVSKTHVRIPENGDPIEARTSLVTRPRRSVAFAELPTRRSHSAPRPSEAVDGQRVRRSHEETAYFSCDVSSQGGSEVDSASDVPGPSGPTVVNGTLLSRRRSRSMGGGLDLQHDFVSRRMWHDTKCANCRDSVGFGRQGLVCSDCRLTVHAHCQAFITQACVPDRQRPNADHAGGKWLDLNKIAPQRSPRVPAVFVQLIRHIEERMEEGLYRIPGSMEQVRKLKREFLKNNYTVRLDNVEVHVACSLLKNLLSSLTEPLLTYLLWQEFSKSASSSKMEDFYGLINKLPPPNRETLALLMRHFLKIARTPLVRMGASNLVKGIAPTLVGNSRPDEKMTAALLTSESFHQQMMMSKLMDIHAQFWDDILECVPAGSNSSSSLPPAHYSPDPQTRLAPSDRFLQEGLAGYRDQGNSFSNVARAVFGNGSRNNSKSRLEASHFKSPLMSD